MAGPAILVQLGRFKLYGPCNILSLINSLQILTTIVEKGKWQLFDCDFKVLFMCQHTHAMNDAQGIFFFNISIAIVIISSS